MKQGDEGVELTLYSRVNCPLCDEMQASLESAILSQSFHITVVDIDQDAILQQKFNADVPVLAHENEIICAHFFDITLLKAFLETCT